MEMNNLEKFSKTLLDTNRSFDFYVDWSKLDNLLDEYLIEISVLNSLIGIEEKKYDETLGIILKKFPSAINVFIYLMAISNAEKNRYISGRGKLKVINSSKLVPNNTDMNIYDLEEYKFNFKRDDTLNKQEIEKYIDFTKKSGIKMLFTKYLDENLYDYIKGCEIGLDTNARKNRGGNAFEIAVEPVVTEICNKYDIKILTQKRLKVLNDYGFDVNNEIEPRIADFILLKDNKAMNMEVNFFGGSGSKPQEIIDAYITRQENLKDSNIGFIMLTDGLAWRNSVENSQIAKGFKNIKYILNYNMAKSGFLEKYITEFFDEDIKK